MEFFEEPIDETKVTAVLEKYKGEKELIHALQDIQAQFGYVPKKAVEIISSKMGIYQSRIFGVLTFYSQFTLIPKGKNIVQICVGTACHVRGCDAISQSINKKLGLNGTGTTPDKKFTVQHVACVGACAKAPVLIVNDDVYGKVTPTEIDNILEKY